MAGAGGRLALAGLTALLAIGAAGMASTMAQAASNVTPQLQGTALTAAESRRQQLFAQMLSDPGNVAVTLEYAKLSSEVGDLEGAVSALERLAIFAPELGQIKFELGVLYLRLAAYDLAASDFKAAAAAPDATPDLKARAAAFLAGIDRQTAGDKLTGAIVLGAQYQTNANGGTDNRLIELGGIPVTLSDSAMARPDTNGFISGNLHYSHDLASQGDRIDADLAAFGSLYAQLSEIDTAAVEARLGPVFNLQRFGIAHSTLGIYAIGGAMEVQQSPYRYTLGAGAVVTADFDSQTQAHVRLEYRYEDFINSSARPTVSQMTGNRTRLSTDLGHAVTDWLSLSAVLYGERKDATVGYDADWEAGATLGTTIRFKGPVADQARPWSLDMSVGVIEREFDAPDTSMSTDRRHDDEANAQATLTVPIGDTWSGLGTVAYRTVLSNYDIYTLDDISTSLAVMKKF